MNGKRAALVAIGAELVMAASIGVSGVIGLHGHVSASGTVSAPSQDYRTEVVVIAD